MRLSHASLLGGLVLILALVAVPSLARTVGSPAELRFEPKASVGRQTVSDSVDWSGFAVTSKLATPRSSVVSAVRGSWTVPTVSETTAGYSAVWVGIDGYSDNTVEQIGTEQNWTGGSPVYYAWYEMAPRLPHTIARVYPGDSMSASVTYLGSNRFKLTISDSTAGHSFAFETTQTMVALRESAEWIVEAPSSTHSVLPLANFGLVRFTGAKVTIGGHSGTISDSTWQSDLITMASRRGAVQAQPSALSSEGSSFTVKWENSHLPPNSSLS